MTCYLVCELIKKMEIIPENTYVYQLINKFLKIKLINSNIIFILKLDKLQKKLANKLVLQLI